MLIRNATALLGARFCPGTELRLMHGAVQEIGCGLTKGLYESELDLAGDYLLPGLVAVRRDCPAEELPALSRRLYRRRRAAHPRRHGDGRGPWKRSVEHRQEVPGAVLP